MRINQNIAAFNAYRNLNQTQGDLSSSLEKLSSGFRINRAADDAAGLVNSENLRSQTGGLEVASRNAQDAISMVQTAEGAQTEAHSILQRMRDLAVQSANEGANDDEALQANQDEIEELKAELNRIAGQTQYGTERILGGNVQSVTVDGDDLSTATNDDGDTVAEGDYVEYEGEWHEVVDNSGTLELDNDDSTVLSDIDTDGDYNVAFRQDSPADQTNDYTFQVGANEGQTVEASTTAVFAFDLGVDGIDVTDDAGGAITEIDEAISTVSSNRGELGAFQNRMESTIRNVSVAVENLSAAEGRIRDTDMADEMVDFTRNQILQQAGTAMLAQANQVPQSVLSLLQ
ncbi:MAG: flagellin [Nitriliruptoraceae bacterium]